MAGKRKYIITSIFALIIIAAATAALLFNIRDTQEGVKNFRVEIISERDGYHETTAEKSALLFLGEYLRTLDYCQYQESDFGIFVEGFHGMEQDFGEGWWWEVAVNGEGAMVGVDEIPIIDNDTYTFTLRQGW